MSWYPGFNSKLLKRSFKRKIPGITGDFFIICNLPAD